MKPLRFFLTAVTIVLLVSLLTLALQSCDASANSTTLKIGVEIVYETPTYEVLMITNPANAGTPSYRSFLLAPKEPLINHSEIK